MEEIMPNWVANIVKAPRRVLAEMLGEKGNVDFRHVVPLDIDWPWKDVSFYAEVKARTMIASLYPEKTVMTSARCILDREFYAMRSVCAAEVEELLIDVLGPAGLKSGLLDAEFEQLKQMLQNFEACGNMHVLDFARERWGTKWNVERSAVNLRAKTAWFYTAWDCPQSFLQTLSRKFPRDTIEVCFADEDRSNNCGRFALKAGEYMASDIAPPSWDQSSSEALRWTRYAADINWEVQTQCRKIVNCADHFVTTVVVDRPCLAIDRPPVPGKGSMKERWQNRRPEDCPALELTRFKFFPENVEPLRVPPLDRFRFV
jgi:hypothetical protein